MSSETETEREGREGRTARFADPPPSSGAESASNREKEEMAPLRDSSRDSPARVRSRQQRTVSHYIHEPPYGKLGNAGPLGLLGFALTTFVLGLYQCGAGLPHSDPKGDVGPADAVFGLAIFMGGFAQFVAGVMSFCVGNSFGCTVHCSYGAFWLSFAMFMVPTLDLKGAYKGNERAYSFAVGIYLIMWCFLTIIFLVAALRTNISILLVFFTLALSFFFLSLACFLETEHLTASVRTNKAGGAFAVGSAFFSFYAGASGLMTPETTWVYLPLGELSSSDEADTV